MSAKVKIGEHHCSIKNGSWSCKNKELEREMQSFCDDTFESGYIYLVDVDEQSAKLVKKYFGAIILEIIHEDDGLPENTVY